EFGEVLRQLPLRMSPWEVCVRLTEPDFSEPVHDLWTGKRFGQKQRFRMFLLDLADAPLPEWKRFGMGIVDAEDGYAVADPEVEHGLQLVPQRLPCICFEVERVDVLILLGWILGVLDGPIGTLPKPLGV